MFCLIWKSKTMQNSVFLLFLNYLSCFSLQDDILIYNIAEILKTLQEKCKIALNFLFYVS